ncbi:MerR family transcriptional regulator [Pseudonocardia sp. TRM90224]|uniref:MerR family transcriptional regulator n=1 Tax=Pseudonocardia sp. TRM90224 TaxID=2812678 RepID=UPI001E30FC0B|nr:MerR family transcriptional regulator [Pseudonocardia sp. TRM90224]
MDEAQLSIGHFARISGLSVHTLRHYDEVGLLRPDTVDDVSRYRRYRREQVATARLIRSLRCLGLAIDDIVDVLAATADDARAVLERHRHRLEIQRTELDVQLGNVARYIEKGVSVESVVQVGCRPVQIKLAVKDAASAARFYQDAFGCRYEVTRRAEDTEYHGLIFGTYGRDDFFLMHFIDDPADMDQPGSSTFGLLVDDLDAVHARAVQAGGSELFEPHEPEGMPRCSAVRDPSGNWVWLYQA